MAMGMNNFDSIAFLTQFNEGYAMTIKAISKEFHVVDEHKEGDGGDKVATIKCHNSKGVPGPRGTTFGADSPKQCNDPTFHINRLECVSHGHAVLTRNSRELIHLPNIDETADKVFDRIIPAPNGDCKLIAHVSYFNNDKTMRGELTPSLTIAWGRLF